MRKGFNFTLGLRGCSMEKDGKSVPLYLERNSLRVEAHVWRSASKPGSVAAGSAVTDDHIKDANVEQSHASSSAGSAREPSAGAPTARAPVLRTWSTIKELHSRLRELGAPIYGTKDVLFRRLCECEQVAARKKEEEYLENRRKELEVATQPVTPKILPRPAQPSEVERQHHLVNHLPPAPWCELCVMGRGKDDPHLRSDLREQGEQLSVIAFDFAFVKTTSSAGGEQDRNLLRLWLLWTQTCSLLKPFRCGERSLSRVHRWIALARVPADAFIGSPFLHVMCASPRLARDHD